MLDMVIESQMGIKPNSHICDRGGERSQVCAHADQFPVRGEKTAFPAASDRQGGPRTETGAAP